MKRTRIEGWIFLLLLAFPFASAQKYPPAALRADLDTLYQTLQDVHPDLFAVAGRERLDSLVTSIHSQLDQADSIPRTHFYYYLLPLFDAIGDGHTVLMPIGHPGDATPSLPFDIVMPDDSTLRIKRNWLAENPIPVGARIDSINGQGAKELIQRFLPWQPGERMHFRLACIGPSFPQYYYRWNTQYRTFSIHATAPDGTICRDTVDAIPYRIRRQEEQARQQNERLFEFRILSDTVALLNLRSLTGGAQFQSFLDSMFRVLRDRQIPNLIIDIQANPGGYSPEGNMLLRYLSDKPFHQFEVGILKYSRQRAEKELANYRSRYPKRFTDEMILCKINKDRPFGTLDTIRVTTLEKPHRKRNRYQGKAWLLTSHYTYSSAANLSWAFKYFGMGTVVGEETGGMSVAFGVKRTYRLPHTGITYSISVNKLYEYGATDENIQGTLPDYPVPADEALDYTLQLIRRGAVTAR